MNFKQFYMIEHYEYYKDVIRKYNSIGSDNIYMSFTNIFKLGINPKSEFRTPIGIYTYPINIKKIPFFGIAPPKYVWFIKPKDNAKCLNLDKCTYSVYLDNLNKLEKYFNKSFVKLNKDDNLSQHIYNIIKINTNYNNIEQNTVLFKILGYDYVIDNGHGIIHKNEKTQTLFLNPVSFVILEVAKFEDGRLDEYEIKKKLKTLSGNNLLTFINSNKKICKYVIKHDSNFIKLPNIDVILKALKMNSDDVGVKEK